MGEEREFEEYIPFPDQNSVIPEYVDRSQIRPIYINDEYEGFVYDDE